jgi:DNA-directed RNA polymerase subunit RPC12/RpoP
MANEYVCSKCKKPGSKKSIPYKIIYDTDGMSVKFIGQLCEDCYKKIFNQNEQKEKTETTK